MSLRVLRVFAALLLAACAHRPAAVTPTGDRVEVALYRDAALVKQRRTAPLAAGRNQVVFDGVAPTLVPGSARLTVAGGGADVIEARHAPPVGGDQVLRGWIGREVAVGEARGILRAVSPDHLVVEVGAELRVLARPVEVRGPAEAGRAGQLRWIVAARSAGARSLEAVYAVGGLAWRAGYTLVLAGDKKSAWLEGWLSVDNHTGGAVAADRASLIDQRFTLPPPAAASAPAVEPPPARRVALRMPLRVADGRRVELPLVAGGGRRVPAALTAVFDPVGYRLDQRRREPVADEAYGAGGDGERPLATTVEVDLGAAGLDAAALPPGECLVLERSGLALVPVGRARAFDHGHDRDRDRDRDRATGAALRLAIGGASHLVGTRRRTEITRDPDARRLVEEFRIAIENRRAASAQVLVREHLYRGLNWSLAYSNDAARVTKEGPQEILFRMTLPAHATREVVYRVVYTW